MLRPSRTWSIVIVVVVRTPTVVVSSSTVSGRSATIVKFRRQFSPLESQRSHFVPLHERVIQPSDVIAVAFFHDNVGHPETSQTPKKKRRTKTKTKTRKKKHMSCTICNICETTGLRLDRIFKKKHFLWFTRDQDFNHSVTFETRST